jgi:acetyl esterase
VTVDAQLAAILQLMNSAPPLAERGAAQARAGFRLFTVEMRDPATLPAVRAVEDTTYPAAEGPMRARVFRPDVDGPVPTVLFVHGGGYVMGDVDTHEDQARLLCREVGAVVFSVDYRLAPEHPFPAGHLDVTAALRHVVATVDSLGGDVTRIAVAGDSAGGNLCAGAAVVARDEGLPLKVQLLLYPSTDLSEAEHPSRVEKAEGFFLTIEDMVWFHEQYAADGADPRASVLRHPDLRGVAPAIVVTAEHDPLRDEGELYAGALLTAGVPVLARRFDGLVHGFFGLGHVHDASLQASLQVCTDLKEMLG